MTLAALLSAAVLVAAADVAPPPPPPPLAPPPPAEVAPPSAIAAVTPAKDARALELLKRMGDKLKAARTFTVKLRTSVEIPAGGVLSTFYNRGSLEVARPDRLAASREGDLAEFHFAYDGKAMTVSAPGTGKWATAAAPPTIAEMLVAAAEQGDLSLPIDELLVDDPYAALTRDLVHAAVVGQATIDGRKVEHLVLVTGGLELQYWLDASTSLPARAVVVYADHPLRPHFSIELSEWRLDHRVKARAFDLPRPKGAALVDFRTAAAAYR